MDGKRPTRPSLIGLFIIIALQLGGFALIWSKDTPSPQYVYLPDTADKTSTDSPVNTPVVVVSPPNEKALREIIKTTLEQELASYSSQATANPVTNKYASRSTPTEPTVKENSSANIQAYTTANSVVQSAIASGKWTADDNQKMMSNFSQLTPQQRDKLLAEISAAINRQELNPQEIPHF